MIARRDLLVGAACLATAGTAETLRPRTRMSLIGNKKFEDVIPLKFAGWEEHPTQAIVAPQSDGSLSAKLYSQIVGRLYANPDYGMVMMLLAYGNTQSDLLQLHRPETCYPAFGFALSDNRIVDIPVTRHVTVPGRALTAVKSDRIEHVLYWTRLGEALPRSIKEQRTARFRSQLSGVIPDGVLVRISSLVSDPSAALTLSKQFVGDLVKAVQAPSRPALIGTERAKLVASDIGSRR